MTRASVLLTVAILLTLPLRAQQQRYDVTVDISNVTKDKDRVKVTIRTPLIRGRHIRYILPSVVPGSATKKDFRRFVHEFYALDENGKQLRAKKKGDNVILLINRHRTAIQKIEYWVDDTWDDEKTTKRQSDADFNFVTPSCGTNFEAGKSFVLNHAAYLGYISGLDKTPYRIVYVKPEKLHATTTMEVKHESPTRDVVLVSTYRKLIDQPIMYCVPDTFNWQTGNTRFHLSVHSESKKISAARTASVLQEACEAVHKFMGDFPVKEYKFIVYYASPAQGNIPAFGPYGAMEHEQCSFYVLPEDENESAMRERLLSNASHELLHLLTPVGIRSEQTADFDFTGSEHSQHLWLYEGVTEYFGMLALLHDSLIDETKFMNTVRKKISAVALSPSYSLTEMSREIFSREYRHHQSLVYDKGMLAAMLLDIRIAEHTGGKRTLRNVILDQYKLFGPSHPFDEDSYISELVAVTDIRLKSFFSDYIIGTKPLPLTSDFEKVGWNYSSVQTDSVCGFGQIGFYYRQADDAFIVKNSEAGNLFKLQDGDRLLSIGGTELSFLNYDELMAPIYDSVPGKTMTLSFQRDEKMMEATATSKKIPRVKEHLLEKSASPSPVQLALRNKIFFRIPD